MHKKIKPNLHTFTTPFKFLGTNIGNRMTTICLPEKQLWIHSPIKPNEQLIQDLTKMGSPNYIINPNLFHHLHLSAFKKQYPNATVYGVPGLEKKQKNLDYINLFENKASYPWKEHIDQVIIEGMPKVNEILFFHKETNTIIMTDLLFNISNEKGLSKCLLTLDGIHGKPAFSKLSKLLITNKKDFKASIDKIFNWKFDTIIMSHGTPITTNAKEKLEQAFKWLDN